MTAFLVRSIASGWKKGSVLAVDAGTHLAAITRIVESSSSKTTSTKRSHKLPDGPFEGFELPYTSSSANAAHITTTLVDTFLITHPHLDHISGFVVNTVIPGSRPKRLAGLPSTIEAFKNHIFNNVIWPNLSDENNGAGLVTYMRLVEGGSPALGEGDTKGYVEICEGLGVKIWGVSHGHCIEHHSHRGSNVSVENGTHVETSPRLTARSNPHRNPSPHSRSARQQSNDVLRSDSHQRVCVVDSSAYFIRDVATGREVLIFGDVEPDTISLSPRNSQVWSEAAPKIASGQLRGIFVECSYDDAQSEDTLFGHLAPRYLIAELKALASEVEKVRDKEPPEKRKATETKKRKRAPTLKSSTAAARRKSPRAPRHSPPVSPRSQAATRATRIEVSKANGGSEELSKNDSEAYDPGQTVVKDEDVLPLQGLKVVIIHVKEKLDDGPDPGKTILKQLRKHEEQARLGCEFLISWSGMAVYL